MTGMKVRGDGNGGFDINVQKAVLRKWGPLGLVGLVVLSGLGSKVGETAWETLTDARDDHVRLDQMAEDLSDFEAEIEAARVEREKLRDELITKMEDVRSSVSDLRLWLMEREER